MSRSICAWAAAGCLAVLGSASGEARADTAALDKLAGAKEAIMSFYGANVKEPGCGAGHMSNIGGAKMVSESADQAVVAVDYEFEATPGSGGTQCSGPASREFTLAKGGSGWTVTGASGMAP